MSNKNRTSVTERGCDALFSLVPYYEGDSESYFFRGQKSANEDFRNDREYSTAIQFMNADVSCGYAYEWKRLTKIKEENDQALASEGLPAAPCSLPDDQKPLNE